jgi:hypothetical protein
MTCRRCAATISFGAKFCPACGAAQPPDPLAGGMPGYLPVPQTLSEPSLPPSPLPAGMRRPTNALAVVALVLGIIWFWWIGSILAVIFGHVARGQIKASGGVQTGSGLAIAGIVLGWVGVGTLSLIVVLALIGH